MDGNEHILSSSRRNLIEMPFTYEFIRLKPTSSAKLRSRCPENTTAATQKPPGFSLGAHFFEKENLVATDSLLANFTSCAALN